MAEYTKSIRLSLSPRQLNRIRHRARLAGVSMNEFVRIAIRQLLDGPVKLDLSKPLVSMTLEEKAFADEVLHIHLIEDR
jgi:hypothetical protein